MKSVFGKQCKVKALYTDATKLTLAKLSNFVTKAATIHFCIFVDHQRENLGVVSQHLVMRGYNIAEPFMVAPKKMLIFFNLM